MADDKLVDKTPRGPLRTLYDWLTGVTPQPQPTAQAGNSHEAAEATREIRLPANDKVRILAVTATTEGPRALPAGPLYMPDFADHLVVPPPPAAKPKGVQ